MPSVNDDMGIQSHRGDAWNKESENKEQDDLKLTINDQTLNWTPLKFTNGKGHLENQSSVKRVGPGLSTASHSQRQSLNEKINFERGPDPKEKAQERPAPGRKIDEG